MRTDGLFQKGVSPSAEMRRRMSEAQKRRWGKPDPELEEFLAKVQRLLDECYAKMRSN